MIWLTWRQFRTAGLAVFAGVALLGVALGVTGPRLADSYASTLASCGDVDACERAVQLFFRSHQGAFLGVAAVVLVLPALIGLFWGAPLISRELETGTHRLVWNQSVTRTRWLVVKLALTGLASVAAAGLCSLAVTWWSSTLDKVSVEDYPRLGSLMFDARGVVPVGYAAFAFALGVTMGMLVRRSLVAMAVTLTVFVAVQLAVPFFVRPYLLPATEVTVPISEAVIDSLMRNPNTGAMRIEGKAPAGAWLLSSRTVDGSGNEVAEIPMALTSGPCKPSGMPGEGMERCFAEIERLGYRQELRYHAASRFWAFQWVETGLYGASALVLGGFCFWWIRRRLS